MGINPWRVGQTLPVLQVNARDDNNVAINLTGAVLSLSLRDLTAGTTRAGQGSWVLTDPVNGVATYTWHAADVASAGRYEVLVTATYATGTLRLDPVYWEVSA